MTSPFEGSGAYEAKVAALEAEGMTTSDAQAAADAEMMAIAKDEHVHRAERAATPQNRLIYCRDCKEVIGVR